MSAKSADRKSANDFEDALYCRQDRGSFAHRALSGKCAVSYQDSDMVDTEAGYGIRFRWCRYLIDLRQHEGTLWFGR